MNPLFSARDLPMSWPGLWAECRNQSPDCHLLFGRFPPTWSQTCPAFLLSAFEARFIEAMTLRSAGGTAHRRAQPGYSVAPSPPRNAMDR